MLKFGTIFLRPVDGHDLMWLVEQRNDPELRRYFRQAVPLSIEDQVDWFKTFDGKAYVSCELNSGFPVGYVSLSHINYVVRSAEFSVFVSKDKRGKGYGRDTMRAILKHAFEDLNLNKVYSEVFIDNPCLSNQFYDKLGFKREGLLRQAAYKDGKYLDSVFIGILRDEYFNSGDGLDRKETLSKPVGPVG